MIVNYNPIHYLSSRAFYSSDSEGGRYSEFSKRIAEDPELRARRDALVEKLRKAANEKILPAARNSTRFTQEDSINIRDQRIG